MGRQLQMMKTQLSIQNLGNKFKALNASIFMVDSLHSHLYNIHSMICRATKTKTSQWFLFHGNDVVFSTLHKTIAIQHSKCKIQKWTIKTEKGKAGNLFRFRRWRRYYSEMCLDLSCLSAEWKRKMKEAKVKKWIKEQPLHRCHLSREKKKGELFGRRTS